MESSSRSIASNTPTPRPSLTNSSTDAAGRRRSSTLHYQTFANIKPPTSRGGRRMKFWSRSSSNVGTTTPNSSSETGTPGSSSPMQQGERSPLPWKQLMVLATIALIEQTAFNSIGPYLPQMTESFPEVKEGQVGLYVGMIASAFALAQFVTNFFWGWLSDRIGRKPVILFGTIGSAGAFLAFGFSKQFWHAIVAQVLLGLVNGNQGLVATVLGEITDKSNQSRAFTYLPVLFAVGAITGPALGGVLVDEGKSPLETQKTYPYLMPNVVAACLLVIQSLIVMVFLNESLHEINDMPPLGERISGFLAWLWCATTSHLPESLRRFTNNKNDRLDSRQDSTPAILAIASTEHQERLNIFTVDTILLLVTFFIFQLSNVAYNVLYPVFGEGKPPTGRNLSAEEIGISMASAGLLAILFQIFIYGPVRTKMGNRSSYRLSHLLFAVAFAILPFVGYMDQTGFGQGKRWVWLELGGSLAVKTIAAVGGLTCAMLMITNSAANHAHLGRLNGLAQTLSAAGRAIGPFMSGGLFSAASRVTPKGEALPFGIFTGIAIIGFGLSFGIRDECLEAEDWEDMHTQSEAESDTDQEQTPLLAGGQRRS